MSIYQTLRSFLWAIGLCLTMMPFTAAAQLPDLTLNSNEHDFTAQAGGNLEVTLHIGNFGAAPVNQAVVEIQAPVNGQNRYIASAIVGAVPMGTLLEKRVTFPIAGCVPPGEYLLEMRIYPVGQEESNAGNNYLFRSLTLGAGTGISPDLMVTAAQAPNRIEYYEPFSGFQASVINQSDFNFQTGALVEFFLSTDNQFSSNDYYISFVRIDVPLGIRQTVSAANNEVYRIASGVAPPGQYFWLAVIDRTGRICETNDNNNIFIIGTCTVGLQITDEPDLSGSIAAAPGSVYPGQQLRNTEKIRVTVDNLGYAAAGPFKAGVYLSSDQQSDASDVLIGEIAFNSFPARSLNSLYDVFLNNAAPTIPANTPDGNYYFLLFVDRENTVAESNESNNIITQAVTVAQKSDLTISISNVTPTPFYVGQSFTVNYSVGNIGQTASPPAATRLTFMDAASNEYVIALVNVPSLAPGAQQALTANFTVPSTAAAGTGSVRAFADPDNTIPELNENNNFSNIGSVCLFLNKWEITNVSGPSSAQAGGSITVSITLKNLGNQATLPDTIGIYQTVQPWCFKGPCFPFAEKVSTNTVSVPSVPAGGSVTKSFTFNLKPSFLLGYPYGFSPAPNYGPTYLVLGTKPIMVSTYGLGCTTQYAYPITPAYPNTDLALSAQIASTTYGPDGKFGYTLQIRNKGPEAAKNVIVELGSCNTSPMFSCPNAGTPTLGRIGSGRNDFASIIKIAWFIDQLPAGGSASVPLTFDLTNAYIPIPDTFRTRPLIVDQYIADPNPSDNSLNLLFRKETGTTAGFELSMTASPMEYRQYETVTFKVNLKNTGTTTASNVEVLLPYSSDWAFTGASASQGSYNLFSKSWIVGNMAPGATAQMDLTLFTLVKDKDLTITAQVKGTNVQTSVTVTPVPAAQLRPDLSVSDLKGLPATAQQNTVIPFTFDLINSGTVATPEGTEFFIGAFLSSDNLWGPNDRLVGTVNTGFIKPGTVQDIPASISIPGDLPLGPYYLILFADYTGVITELNEDNNKLVSASTIALVGRQTDVSISLSTDQPVYNDLGIINYKITVRNNGPVTAQGLKIKLGGCGIPKNVACPTFSNVTKGSIVNLGTIYSTDFEWQISSLVNGESASMTLSISEPRLGPTYTATHRVVLTSPEDSNLANNEASLTFTKVIPGQADVGISLSSDVLFYNDLGIINYKVTVKNNGPATATGIKIGMGQCAIPKAVACPRFSEVSKGTIANIGDIAIAIYEWQIDALAAGESATAIIGIQDGRIGATYTASHTVAISSPTDPVTDNNTASLTFTRVTTAGVDLELSMTANPALYRIYTNVTYKLTLRNQGNVAAQGITVSFPMPDGMVYTSQQTTKGSYSLFTYIWDPGTLAAGESTELELVLFTLVGNRPITAFAQVKTAAPGDIDSAPGNNTTTIPKEDDEAAVTIQPVSSAVSLRNAGETSQEDISANVWPVPLRDEATLELNAPAGAIQLYWLDIQGRIVKQQSLDHSGGLYRAPVDISGFNSGVYWLRIQTEANATILKLVKQ